MTAASQVRATYLVQARRGIRKIRPTPDALLIVAISLATAPLLFVFFRRLWLSEHYQFFPLVLAASAWLMYLRWPAGRTALAARDRILGYLSLLLGFSLHSVGIALWSPWLHAVGALFTLLFLVIHFGGGQALSHLGTSWLLLWIIVPPPAKIDRQIVLSLQGISSRTASNWLDVLGINHVLSGYVIHVPGQQFLVEEACSGANSFLVLLGLAAIFVVAARYPFFPAVGLVLMAVGCAIIANTARIVSLVGFAHYGIDLSEGLPHTALGIIAFTFAIFLLYSCDRLLRFLMAPLDTEAYNRNLEAKNMSLPNAGRPLLGRIAVSVVFAMFALMGILQIWRSPQMLAREAYHPPLDQLASTVDAQSISPSMGDWSFVEFDPNRRIKDDFTSKCWEFRRGPSVALLSIDFPFLGWHELTYCYTGQGWAVSDRRLLMSDQQNQFQTAAVEFDLERPTGGFGYVIMSIFDQDGTKLPPLPTGDWSLKSLVGLARDRLLRERTEMTPVYQFQVFVSSPSPISGEELARIKELYFEARDQVIQKIRSNKTLNEATPAE